jgi:predicted RNase H-like HicB family nuclease
MEKQTHAYSLVVEREEEGGYFAHFPALPGCQTWGATYEHAVRMAEEALLGYLEALEKSGKRVPVDRGSPARSRLQRCDYDPQQA